MVQKKATSIAEVAAASQIVITMLPNSPQVKEVVFMPEGILNNARKDSILIDMSSIAPEASQEIGKALLEKGIDF